MNKMIVRAVALILALVLVGSLALTAFAAENGNSFNAGVAVAKDSATGALTVTVSDDAETAAILADQQPTLSVICDYTNVTVTYGENELPFVANGETVTFTVANGGTYTITPKYVASVGESKFFTLEEAFAAAGENPVVLLDSYTVAAGTTLTVPTGITLEIPADLTLTVDGKIRLNGAISKAGTIVNPGNILCASHTDNNGKCEICGFLSGVTMAGQSLVLEGDIVQKHYLNIGNVSADAYVEFAVNGKKVSTMPVSAGQQEGIYTVFPFTVAAKEMSAEVTVTVVDGESRSQGYTFSNVDYARTILSVDDPKYLPARPMVKAMLHYGAFAQLHFGYNTDNLANAGLEASGIDAVTMDTLSAYARPTTSNTSSVRFLGSSMILESNTTLRLFFKVTGDIQNITFTYGDQTLTPKVRDGNYYVDIPGICASDLDKDYTVNFTEGTNAGSVTYNPMTYCYTILKTSGYAETLKDLVKSIWLYNQAANAYFA